MVSEVVAVDGDTAVVAAQVEYGGRSRSAGGTCGCCGSATDGRCRAFEEWPFAPGSPTALRPPTDTRSDALLDQAGVHVVEEAADRDRVGDQRVAAHLAYVVAERGLLVLDDAEVLPGRVLAGGFADAGAQLSSVAEAIAQRVCGTTRIRFTWSRCTPRTSASSA